MACPSAMCASRSPTRFEENASTFPPAMVDALRGTIAGLEQALVDAAGVLNTPILVKAGDGKSALRVGAQQGRAAQDRVQALALRLHQL